MPTKLYRIKKRRRCPLNVTELKRVKGGQLIKLPRAKFAPLHYSGAPIFAQQKCIFNTIQSVEVIYSRKSHNAPLPPKLKVEKRVTKKVCFKVWLRVRFNFESGGKGTACDLQE